MSSPTHGYARISFVSTPFGLAFIYVLARLAPLFSSSANYSSMSHSLGVCFVFSRTCNYCRVNSVIYYDFLLLSFRLALMPSPPKKIVTCLVPKITARSTGI